MVMLVAVCVAITPLTNPVLVEGPVNSTSETELRFVPVIVIVIDVLTAPVDGVKLVMVGIETPLAGGT